MAITEKAKAYHEKMFPGYVSPFQETDSEFIERFDNFAFDEVVNSDDLDDKTRWLAILAALLGCQGIDEFKVLVPAAMNFGITPVEIKEVVYQATAYLGIGRVFPFLKAVNGIFTEKRIKVPFEAQLTSHASANMRIGNDKGFLIKVISQCIPYIGYPRSLNALRCVNNAADTIDRG